MVIATKVSVPAEPSAIYLWAVTLVTILPVWMGLMDSSITNVGFDIVAGSLNVSIDEITAITTSYMLAMLISMPLGGWLAANVGRKRSFVLSVALFTVASLACALSTSLATLVIARFVQGLGGGAMQTMSGAALVDAYPKDQHVRAFKIWGTGAMLGPIMGPALGGWIFANFAWQVAFLINIPLGIAAIAGGLAFIPNQSEPDETSRFDWWSLSLMAIAFALLLYGLQDGQRLDWFDSPTIAAAVGGGATCFGLFVYRQLTMTNPLVHLSPLRIPSFTIGIGLTMVCGVGQTGTAFIIPLYFQQVLGFGTALTGLGVLPSAVATIAAIQMAGTPWGKRVRPIPMTLIALGCAAAGTAWFALLGTRADFAQILAPRLLQGFGSGLLFIPLNVLTVKHLRNRDLDGATGLGSVIRHLGTSFAYAGLSALLFHTQVAALAEYSARVKSAHLTPDMGLAPVRDWLVVHGVSRIDAAAYALPVFQTYVQQAALSIAYARTFYILAIFFVLCIPGVAVLWRLTSSGAKST